MTTWLLFLALASAQVPFPDEEIREIRGPVPVQQVPWAPLLAGAATLLLGAGLWRALRRRHPEASPRERALAALEQARRLMGETTSRPLSIALSDIVRGYVEETTSARAAHRTTEEFLADLARGECPELDDRREALSAFLRWCDLGKYAAWTLSLQEQHAMREAALQVVCGTTGETR